MARPAQLSALPLDGVAATHRFGPDGGASLLGTRSTAHWEGSRTWTRTISEQSVLRADRSIVVSGIPTGNRGARKGVVRVTHVVSGLEGGGLESLVAAMARRFVGSRVTVSAVTLSGREGRVGEQIRPLLDNLMLASTTRFLSLLHPRSLARTIAATRPDIVHIHSGCWYIASRAAALAGVRRIVFTEHGREFNDPPLWRALDRRASMRTHDIVAVSDRLASYLVNTVRVKKSKVLCIPNGVDTSVFAPGGIDPHIRTKLGLPPDCMLVGSVGRLEPVKAYDRLLHAVADISRAGDGPKIACVIWGDGSERARLSSLAEQLGIRELVRLPGWTDNSAACYRTLDVFALVSTSEGASVSLMEALATGIAPVVTDVGANAEILGPQLSGQVVPSGDQDQLRTVLLRTLNDAQMRLRAGVVGRENVVRRFSLDAMVSSYESLYLSAEGAAVQDVLASS